VIRGSSVSREGVFVQGASRRPLAHTKLAGGRCAARAHDRTDSAPTHIRKNIFYGDNLRFIAIVFATRHLGVDYPACWMS
jgi:hypothetical protein